MFNIRLYNKNYFWHSATKVHKQKLKTLNPLNFCP